MVCGWPWGVKPVLPHPFLLSPRTGRCQWWGRWSVCKGLKQGESERARGRTPHQCLWRTCCRPGAGASLLLSCGFIEPRGTCTRQCHLPKVAQVISAESALWAHAVRNGQDDRDVWSWGLLGPSWGQGPDTAPMALAFQSLHTLAEVIFGQSLQKPGL